MAPALSLSQGTWEVAATPAGSLRTIDDVTTHAPSWIQATGVTTAAAAQREMGAWSDAMASRRFDGEDWWWRTRFAKPQGDSECWLCFDGIATIAEVWLNGTSLFTSRNMFRRYECDVTALLQANNELVIVCKSLDAELAKKRPRPRWRAPMIENQQLRWIRTTLLGRTPGWSPPVAVVGPWREVRLEQRLRPLPVGLSRTVAVNGSTGNVALRTRFGTQQPDAVTLVVTRNGASWRAKLKPVGDEWSGVMAIEDVQRWWPHTHGAPALYDAALEIEWQGATHVHALPAIGFRSVVLNTDDGDFQLSVNGVRIFARGALWSPPDVVTLSGGSDAYALTLQRVCDAGMNMLRIPGTHYYESDAFYQACDAAGILIWQDFMFANMDFPDGDPDFVADSKAEVREQLHRLAPHACIALWCGNSEVEQQAAMFGVERARWRSPLFYETIAGLVAEFGGGLPYVASSATGGAFPHQANNGPTSYYGVGAYQRGVDDARRADVRFASECLAFANVPDPNGIADVPGGHALRTHHPLWKMRTPRDLGAGWDFEDVRDFYVKQLFAVDPATLRYSEHDRYLALGRVATGEMMAAAIGEWRRAATRCGGALVLMLSDLWAGAGWGVLDSAGRPKAAWHYLRRAMAAMALALTDEGGNGVTAHFCNDSAMPRAGHVRVRLLRHGEAVIADEQRAVAVAAHSTVSMPIAECFEHFYDLSYAYRFGVAAYDVMHVQWIVEDMACHAFYFPTGQAFARRDDLGLVAELRRSGPGEAVVQLTTQKFAQAVFVEIDGYTALDNYVHVAPGVPVHVKVTANAGASADTQPNGAMRGSATALNAYAAAKISMQLEAS
ncbi:MAG TPA: hypothetical protein PLF40_03510 [Kofleriaceae bacterium]|nr:hypothetical protein [Kofleriaceae bacterium]